MAKGMDKRAFTLVELLITMVVAVIVISGVILSLINTMVLNEYNQEFSIAMNIARAQLEQQIANRSDFDNLISSTGTLTKSADGLDGLYRVDITNPYPDLRDISVAVCWKSRGGRIIGDCVSNGGNLAWVSPNSSPCFLSTSLARR